MAQTDDGQPLVENRIATDEASAPFLTAQQLAKRLNLKDFRKIYRMANAREIPGLKVGGEWRFIWEDVLSSLKERSAYGIQGS